MKNLRKVLIAVCLPVAMTATALGAGALGQRPASQSASLQQQLQSKFDELHKAAAFPGGTAGFVLSDGSSFALAVGVSDRTTKAPMKTTDRLLLGSVGKTYVSAVALQMINEKKFRLDDTLDKFFGDAAWFPRLANAPKITVRHLMTHTSGIVRYELNPKFTKDLSANPDRVWTGEARLAYLLDATPPFAPGEGWEYSDTNYIVLGMIIERVGGIPYYEQLKKRVLEPHGLKDTVAADSRTVPGLVQGYAGADNPFGGTDEMIKDGRFAVNPQFEWTGGGLAVTSLDLARWGKLLYEGKALPPHDDGDVARRRPGAARSGVEIRTRCDHPSVSPRHHLRAQRFHARIPDRARVLPRPQDRDRRAGELERSRSDRAFVAGVRRRVRRHHQGAVAWPCLSQTEQLAVGGADDQLAVGDRR